MIVNSSSKIFILVIAILSIVVIWQTCRKQPPVQVMTVTKIDTVYKQHKDSLVYVPDSVYVEKLTTLPPEYLPDSNYADLKKRYENLAFNYLERKDYIDTIKLDSVGYVALNDTISKNAIQSRKFVYSYNIPTITKTTTNTEIFRKNQLYVGGFLFGNKTNLINGVDLGIMFKNKNDFMYGLKAGVDGTGSINYGAGIYFKIKLKK